MHGTCAAQGLPGVDGNDLVPKERRNLSIQSGVHYNILSNHNHEDHALPDDDRCPPPRYPRPEPRPSSAGGRLRVASCVRQGC